ncbi:MAG: hypothetical protein JWP64_4203 [Pseudonocardia sp.]|jgi:cell wall-associated NlpC family hydrolase|uniref:C40 family peptidase n=1 Tax=Pseudonocardia sp. TaxID=60912 RepID=UPI00262C7809|nr:NlpC/P60 family protein [Pseudonocardia sp.]MCU1629254.1 hypothetical protein [Pseudonocardia sp.]
MSRTTASRKGDALRVCVVVAVAVLAEPLSSADTAGSQHSSAAFHRVADVGELHSAAQQESAAPPFAHRSQNIPDVILTAYQRAEAVLAAAEPGCGVTWWMLAAIGKMESDHANGGLVDSAGTTLEPILGPSLDGSHGWAAIPSSTAGAEWERARGPMQFLPATWRAYGRGDPHNINDAALAAGRYLCAGAGTLSDPAQLAAALHRYNPSSTYVAAVLAWARAYAGGVVPSLTGPDATALDHMSAASAAAATAAVDFATAQLGLPYVWGGNGPGRGDSGFDCSGLTHAAYVAAGVFTPRTAQTQYEAGPRLPAGTPLQAGDLVFYGTPDRVHHVGLYIGDDEMINAPTFGELVKTARYRWPGDDYLGATRLSGRPGLLPFVPEPVHQLIRAVSPRAVPAPTRTALPAAIARPPSPAASTTLATRPAEPAATTSTPAEPAPTPSVPLPTTPQPATPQPATPQPATPQPTTSRPTETPPTTRPAPTSPPTTTPRPPAPTTTPAVPLPIPTPSRSSVVAPAPLAPVPVLGRPASPARPVLLRDPRTGQLVALLLGSDGQHLS